MYPISLRFRECFRKEEALVLKRIGDLWFGADDWKKKFRSVKEKLGNIMESCDPTKKKVCQGNTVEGLHTLF